MVTALSLQTECPSTGTLLGLTPSSSTRVGRIFLKKGKGLIAGCWLLSAEKGWSLAGGGTSVTEAWLRDRGAGGGTVPLLAGSEAFQ